MYLLCVCICVFVFWKFFELRILRGKGLKAQRQNMEDERYMDFDMLWTFER